MLLLFLFSRLSVLQLHNIPFSKFIFIGREKGCLYFFTFKENMIEKSAENKTYCFIKGACRSSNLSSSFKLKKNSYVEFDFN